MDKYKKSGVDVEKAEGLAGKLRDKFPGLGGYAGIYRAGDGSVLAATCDGVGTKIRLAIDLDMHEVVGEDLVAMSINDLIAGGAKPLFFLDYFSCGILREDIFMRVMSGIESGLKKSECILLGGETAEMPGMYSDNDYDLAGFAVGSVHMQLNRDAVNKGDVIVGLPSSGIHSNGFSLVRSIFSDEEIRRHRDLIMKPTVIYSRLISSGQESRGLLDAVKSMAHVTGGGVNRALTRLLPAGLSAEMDLSHLPEIFEIMMDKGVQTDEMLSVFNMGIGMLIVTEPEKASATAELLGGRIVGNIS